MKPGNKNHAVRSVMMLMGGILLFGCSEAPQTEVKVGADTDAHGCKGSAGYQWCAKTNQCERPWELAKKENFENSEAAFSAFCREK
ncbi:serine protease [Photobacterium japonica]|uniref:serine protease n=1 Tax=Photobacterium japonica TaxID=2910235 RepID=UPI003D135648